MLNNKQKENSEYRGTFVISLNKSYLRGEQQHIVVVYCGRLVVSSLNKSYLRGEQQRSLCRDVLGLCCEFLE